MSERKTVRIFISSPGDVADERIRAALVLGRLKRDFARFFSISPNLWEYEPMIANGSFQDVIDEPAKSDIVVLILWSRLGTPLPPRTAMREYRGIDGRAPVTGTEWEFENAILAARERKARNEPATPDVLVYKKDVPGKAEGKNAAEMAEGVRQMAALETFWARYFVNPEGQFTLAFNSFTSLDGFEQRLEAHLRDLLLKRIRDEELAPVEWPREPYLGLQSFDFEHAGIFFGRATAVQEVTETLLRRVNTSKAFVLVAGASGAGKSSLVKAGVIPSLTEPGVVLDRPLWRRCIFQPSGDGTMAQRLADALLRDPALPELADLHVTANQLCEELERGEIMSIRYGLVEAARQSMKGRDGLAPTGRLILVVDQLEQLFTDPDNSDSERERFVELLMKMSTSGFVWIIATFRSDFFAQMAGTPGLRDLCSGDGLYHLLPPRSEEIDQMIRLPAEAAGISFEVDARSGIGLDQELRAAAASNPLSLPLLEFTLDELYRRDILARGGRQLRIATYRDELKKLEGAIAARAEAVREGLPDRVRDDVLPEILRSLVAIGEDDRPAARFAPLSEVARTPDRQSALTTLIDARLLFVRGEGQSAVVGVVHEALITEWPFYRDLVAEHALFLRSRGRIAAQAKIWQSEKQEASRLLAPGLALEEGRSLLARREEVAEIAPFIDASIGAAERAGRRKRLALIALASVATVAALFFAYLADYANRASIRAQNSFVTATAALSTVIESMPKKVEPVAPLKTVESLLAEAQVAVSKFLEQESESPQIRRFQAEISLAFAIIEFDLGHYEISHKLAIKAVDALRPLSKASGDLNAQYQLGRGLRMVGATYHQLEELPNAARMASDAFVEAIRTLDGLIQNNGSNPNASDWHLALADVHQDFGDLLLERMRNSKAAKAEYELAILERKKASASNRDIFAIHQDIAWAVNKLGDVMLRDGDRPSAIAKFENARDLIAALGAHLSDNKHWGNHLAMIYNNIGMLMRDDRRYADAIGQFDDAIVKAGELSQRDPNNADLLSVLGWSYDNAGEAWLYWAKSEDEHVADRLAHARARLLEARQIRVRIADQSTLWARDLIYTDASLAAVEAINAEAQGNYLAATVAYVRAADLNDQVASANHRDEAVARTIQFCEWAAAAFMRAGAADKARAQLGRAIQVAKGHHSMAGDDYMASTIKQLEQLIAATEK